MRNIVSILFVLLSIVAFASPTIQSVNLDKESAEKLGFVLEITSEKLGKYISLSGPEELNEGCKPSKAGSFTIDAKGKDISGSISDVRGVKEPTVFGYVSSNTDNNTIVFIDYLCPGSRVAESRRYEASTAPI